MDYKKKAKKKQKEKERKRLQKKFHDDGPDGGQKLRNVIKRDERKKAYDRSGKVIKYKKDEYKAKIKNYAQPRSSDMSMEQLLESLKKQEQKLQKKEDRETKLFGRPKKKGELGI